MPLDAVGIALPLGLKHDEALAGCQFEDRRGQRVRLLLGNEVPRSGDF
jgi:hypothetical protein